MKEILNNIKGDKGIWAIFLLLAIISFLPIYSASSNLVSYALGGKTTTFYLAKHTLLLLSGFILLFIVHKFPYRYFSGASVFLLPATVFLLVLTLMQKRVIGGASASRWLSIPGTEFSFQTSTLAIIVLMIYVARYFSRRKNTEFDFKDSIWFLWGPVAAVLIPILPSNFSTTALIFLSVNMVSWLAGYPFKFFIRIWGIALVSLVLFIFIGSELSGTIKVKAETWKNRITNFKKEEPNPDSIYQIEKAKTAIATGGLFGKGVGKSVQKNFLPQSASDFIFAIIVEEWGSLGAIGLILLYSILLFRIWVIAKNAKTTFSTLLVVGVGFPIIIQTILNMMVATNMVPVTGQTLPLLSDGGTSIWMTFFAIGIILSVSVANNEGDKLEILTEENPLDVLYEAVD